MQKEKRMPVLASDSGGADFEQVPPGNYDAICYKLVDGGTTMNEFKGEVKKQHSVFIWWELPELTMGDDRPMTIFNKYTLSLHEKAKLRQHLQAWRNKPFTQKELEGFDLTKILGTTCKLSVELNANGNSKVTGVFAADGGAKKAKTVNDLVVFDLEEYCKEFSGESSAESKKMCDLFEDLPRFVQYAIAGCDEPGKEQIPACFEVQAAKEKGASSPVVQQPPATDEDDDFEDDVPF